MSFRSNEYEASLQHHPMMRVVEVVINAKIVSIHSPSIQVSRMSTIRATSIAELHERIDLWFKSKNAYQEDNACPQCVYELENGEPLREGVKHLCDASEPEQKRTFKLPPRK